MTSKGRWVRACTVFVAGLGAALAACGEDTPPTSPEQLRVELRRTPAVLSSEAPAVFEFAAPRAASYVCRFDGVLHGCASPASFTLTDGAHELAVYGIGEDGLGGVPTTFAWTADLTAPDTTIITAPAAVDNTLSPIFTFTSADPDAVSFECVVGDTAFTACTSPFTPSVAVGPQHVAIRALDAAGNRDASPAERVWQVDLATPDTVFRLAPADGSTTGTSATFELEASTPVDHFECSSDGGPYVRCDASFVATGLAEGEHLLRVRAVLPTGIADGSPAERRWFVDATGPALTLEDGPPSQSNTSVPAFVFASSDATTFECQVVGVEPFTPCTSGWSPTVPLPDDRYVFQVRATDAYGNVTVISYQWVVDRSPPTVTVAGAPTGTGASTTATFTVGVERAGHAMCSLDGAPPVPCAGSVTFADLHDGQHTLVVTVTDPAGNVTVSTSAWSVDTTAPVLGFASAPAALSNDASPTFVVTADDLTPVAFACSLDGVAPAPCTPPVTFHGLPDGEHTLTVSATDELGHTSSTHWTFSVDTAAPAIAITAVGALGDASGRFTLTTEVGASSTCSLDGALPSPCRDTVLYAGLRDGDHTLEVTSTDAAGNAAVRTEAWVVDTTAPVLGFASQPPPLSNQVSPTFTITVSDRSAVTLQCALDGAALAPCTTQVELVGLPDGDHELLVVATDAFGHEATTGGRFTVDTLSPALDVTTIGTLGHATAAFQLVTDRDATLACSLDGALPVDCADRIDYVDLGAGPHDFQVTSRDGAGNATGSETAWSVDPAPVMTLTVSNPTTTPITVQRAHVELRLADGSLASTVDDCLVGTSTAASFQLISACIHGGTGEVAFVHGAGARGPQTITLSTSDGANTASAAIDLLPFAPDPSRPTTAVDLGEPLNAVPQQVVATTTDTYVAARTIDGLDLLRVVGDSTVKVGDFAAGDDGVNGLFRAGSALFFNVAEAGANRLWHVDAGTAAPAVDAGGRALWNVRERVAVGATTYVTACREPSPFGCSPAAYRIDGGPAQPVELDLSALGATPTSLRLGDLGDRALLYATSASAGRVVVLDASGVQSAQATFADVDLGEISTFGAAGTRPSGTEPVYFDGTTLRVVSQPAGGPWTSISSVVGTADRAAIIASTASAFNHVYFFDGAQTVDLGGQNGFMSPMFPLHGELYVYSASPDFQDLQFWQLTSTGLVSMHTGRVDAGAARLQFLTVDGAWMGEGSNLRVFDGTAVLKNPLPAGVTCDPLAVRLIDGDVTLLTPDASNHTKLARLVGSTVERVADIVAGESDSFFAIMNSNGGGGNRGPTSWISRRGTTTFTIAATSSGLGGLYRSTGGVSTRIALPFGQLDADPSNLVSLPTSMVLTARSGTTTGEPTAVIIGPDGTPVPVVDAQLRPVTVSGQPAERAGAVYLAGTQRSSSFPFFSRSDLFVHKGGDTRQLTGGDVQVVASVTPTPWLDGMLVELATPTGVQLAVASPGAMVLLRDLAPAALAACESVDQAVATPDGHAHVTCREASGPALYDLVDDGAGGITATRTAATQLDYLAQLTVGPAGVFVTGRDQTLPGARLYRLDGGALVQVSDLEPAGDDRFDEDGQGHLRVVVTAAHAYLAAFSSTDNASVLWQVGLTDGTSGRAPALTEPFVRTDAPQVLQGTLYAPAVDPNTGRSTIFRLDEASGTWTDIGHDQLLFFGAMQVVDDVLYVQGADPTNPSGFFAGLFAIDAGGARQLTVNAGSGLQQLLPGAAAVYLLQGDDAGRTQAFRWDGTALTQLTTLTAPAVSSMGLAGRHLYLATSLGFAQDILGLDREFHRLFHVAVP